MDEFELNAGVIESDGELMELSFVSTGQRNGEGAGGKVARRRLTCCMNQLRCLHARRKVSTDNAVVSERILLNCCGLATSSLNGSRACRHHKLLEVSVKLESEFCVDGRPPGKRFGPKGLRFDSSALRCWGNEDRNLPQGLYPWVV